MTMVGAQTGWQDMIFHANVMSIPYYTTDGFVNDAEVMVMMLF